MKTYEETYKDQNHFSFGRNWQNFLRTLNNEKIEEAKKSLVDFLGGEENIKGKTFVDIGCGSGLFSLAAYLLGAKEVVSVDVDEFSIACTRYLKGKNGNPQNWVIKQGSALDENFIRSLGQFDVVYSWGVLHHTGNMYTAFNNIVTMVKTNGLFYLAIYNKFTIKWRGGTSDTWLKIKKTYNSSNSFVKKIMNLIYMAYSLVALVAFLKNPIKYIRNYKSSRGMDWHTDLIDWIGGYPYEFASVDEITEYFKPQGFLCKSTKPSGGLGCNEFLLSKSNE